MMGMFMCKHCGHPSAVADSWKSDGVYCAGCSLEGWYQGFMKIVRKIRILQMYAINQNRRAKEYRK